MSRFGFRGTIFSNLVSGSDANGKWYLAPSGLLIPRLKMRLQTASLHAHTCARTRRGILSTRITFNTLIFWKITEYKMHIYISLRCSFHFCWGNPIAGFKRFSLIAMSNKVWSSSVRICPCHSLAAALARLWFNFQVKHIAFTYYLVSTIKNEYSNYCGVN